MAEASMPSSIGAASAMGAGATALPMGALGMGVARAGSSAMGAIRAGSSAIGAGAACGGGRGGGGEGTHEGAVSDER